MRDPVDILLITWNRIDYVKLSLPQLFNDSDEFRLYWWDNGSADGTYEYIMECKDERMVMRHRSYENVKQSAPTRWFLQNSTSDVIGKTDDDILLPKGWIKALSEAVREEEKFGMIGCWTFMKEDFERNRAKAISKLVKIGRHRIIQNAWIGGAGIILRKELALKYIEDGASGNSFAVKKESMSMDGFKSGWYFPLIYAEHMDDPHSSHCSLIDNQKYAQRVPLTAFNRGIKSADEYLRWIKNDADKILGTSIGRQLLEYKLNSNKFLQLLKKIARRTKKYLLRR